MKLKQNVPNIFNVKVIKNNEELQDVIMTINYYVGEKHTHFYKIDCDECGTNFFSQEFEEGAFGFSQHIISNEKYHIVFKEKHNLIELITWNNSVFVFGKMLE